MIAPYSEVGSIISEMRRHMTDARITSNSSARIWPSPRLRARTASLWASSAWPTGALPASPRDAMETPSALMAGSRYVSAAGQRARSGMTCTHAPQMVSAEISPLHAGALSGLKFCTTSEMMSRNGQLSGLDIGTSAAAWNSIF